MARIPHTALILGLAGVLPFAWGALTLLLPELAVTGRSYVGPRFVGPYVQLFYGAIILSFMSGVLWGFATKAEGTQASIGYVLSVVPALWAFFMTGSGAQASAVNLIIGFVALLLIDFAFWRWGLAPPWWMNLRVLLTSLVVLCLALTAYMV